VKRNSTPSNLPATATQLVLPQQLAQQAADAVRELLAEAGAANTTRSYTAALRYWAGWQQGRYGIELELPVSELPLSIPTSLTACGYSPTSGFRVVWN